MANENVPGAVIRVLRLRGHDVLSVKESMRGKCDQSILECAQADDRLVVTLDKDFGELAFRFGLPATLGVVLFRLSGTSPEIDCERMISVLESREREWTGHFAVVSDNRIRLRKLPRRS